MDGHRFDLLTKALGADGSRRKLFKGLLGLGGAVAISGTAFSGETEAARRPAPSPTPVPKCPGKQTWSGGQCTCPGGLSKCGSDCCNPTGAGAAQSECCDNACCFGTCYGEELCCPSPRSYCATTGECCPEGIRCCEGVGCLDSNLCCSDADCRQLPNSFCNQDHTCACAPDTCASLGVVCGEVSDGCGILLDCGCCSDEVCRDNDFPNGFCDQSTHQCACTQSSCEELGGCGQLSDGCAGTIECGCGLGLICVGGACVDDISICVAGEEYCTGTNGAFCGGGNCFCKQGVDGTTYCIGFLYEGVNECGNCTSNVDCAAKTGDPSSVCVNHSVGCQPCNGNGACAQLCAQSG